MSKTKSKADETVPEWFSVEPSDETLLHIKEAVVNYIIDLPNNAPEPDACKATNLAILPYVKKINPEWEDVTPQNYNTYRHKAHKKYDQTIRNYLDGKALPLDLEKTIALAKKTAAAVDRTSSQYEVDVGSDDDDMYRKNHRSVLHKNSLAPKKKVIRVPGSGKLSPKKEFPVESVLKKRDEPMQSEIYDDSYKRTKYEELEILHKDMIEMAQIAEATETRWRALRNTLEFIKSPRGTKN